MDRLVLFLAGGMVLFGTVCTIPTGRVGSEIQNTVVVNGSDDHW